MLSVVHAVVVCLSVRLFVCVCLVTLQYCMKPAKRRITQIMPHDRPGTLVFKWDFFVVVRSLCHSIASCFIFKITVVHHLRF